MFSTKSYEKIYKEIQINENKKKHCIPYVIKQLKSLYRLIPTSSLSTYVHNTLTGKFHLKEAETLET